MDGKTSDGYDVSQSLNEWCVLLSAFCREDYLISSYSQICSSWGIQDGYKWQFCSKTHVPYFRASWIAFTAIGPWF